MTSVVVFDYGFGNVRSMVRALANLDLDVTLTSDYRQSLEADGLVVPGVGAFAACMEGLHKVRGDRVVTDRLRLGRPVLGVCVGEQVMFQHGSEHGVPAAGLGLIGGAVGPLDADVVPHMGWDTVEAPENSTLLDGLDGRGSISCIRMPPPRPRRWGRMPRRSISATPPSVWDGARTAAAGSWPPMSAGRCSPRSSIPRNRRRPAPGCCATGWASCNGRRSAPIALWIRPLIERITSWL